MVPAGGASAGEGEEELRSTFCRPGGSILVYFFYRVVNTLLLSGCCLTNSCVVGVCLFHHAVVVRL